MKKILNDLKLKFDKPNWALDPELAFIDTVLEQHPELFEVVPSSNLMSGNHFHLRHITNIYHG